MLDWILEIIMAWIKGREETKMPTQPKMTTTGASRTTAAQDGLPAGVKSSRTMARTDWPRIKPLKLTFENIARNYDLEPYVLAAIASRESRAGAMLDARGYGDHGNGFGIMQIDQRYHPGTDRVPPTSVQHIDAAARILSNYVLRVGVKKPSWDAEWRLRGAILAYNAGPSNVQTKSNLDVGSTGNDYSADVWERAKYYAEAW